MTWKAEPTGIAGLLVIETAHFGDARGSLTETFRQDEMERLGVSRRYVQDNQSVSQEGVLRGLHAQGRRPQAKLVRVASGEILDVAVDARTGSPTRGRWFACTLSGDNPKQLFLPEGFLHGFYVVRGPAVVTYRCSEYYDPSDQVGVMWNDPALSIQWPNAKPKLSDKDSKNTAWADLTPVWETWKY